jgi:sterol-4alpha-carboxylate 3-dehydrogenase (decarboxylating)
MPVQKEVYSHTKALADQLAIDANSNSDEMMTPHYGHVQYSARMMRSPRKSFENAAAGQLKYHIGDGKSVFDFVYTDNVLHA